MLKYMKLLYMYCEYSKRNMKKGVDDRELGFLNFKGYV